MPVRPPHRKAQPPHQGPRILLWTVFFAVIIMGYLLHRMLNQNTYLDLVFEMKNEVQQMSVRGDTLSRENHELAGKLYAATETVSKQAKEIEDLKRTLEKCEKRSTL